MFSSAFSFGPLANLALSVTCLGIVLLGIAAVMEVVGDQHLSHAFGEYGFFALYLGFDLLLWFYPGVAWFFQSATGLPELWIDLGVTFVGFLVAAAYKRGW